MLIPLVCLFVATLLPYVWAVFMSIGRKQQLGTLDNTHPRLQQAQLTGMGARAVGAHNNSFEALLIFAPAVVLAVIMGGDINQDWVSIFSIGFVASRIGHGAAYIANMDKLRSSLSMLAGVAVIGLWVQILSSAA